VSFLRHGHKTLRKCMYSIISLVVFDKWLTHVRRGHLELYSYALHKDTVIFLKRIVL
jgi:hypothetical protein